MLKLLQTMLLRRIDAFLSTNIDKTDNLLEVAREYNYVQTIISNEKILEAYHVQQAFESMGVKVQVRELHSRLLVALRSRVVSCFAAGEEKLFRMAELEQTFLAFEALQSVSVFEEVVIEELLKAIVSSTIQHTGLTQIITSLRELFKSDLSWLWDLINLTQETTLVTSLQNTIGSGLLRSVFNKETYFPIDALDQFAENYQLYFSFLTETFGQGRIPPKLSNHLKRKESILYKAYVVNIVKKLEGSLISLSNMVESAKSVEAIEEFCQKKYKKSLLDTLEDLILRNTSKDTVTTSLLHRVYSLGLRTIMRVGEWVKTLDEKQLDPKIREYLTRTLLQLANQASVKVQANLVEIGKKLSLEESSQSKVINLFKDKLLKLKELGIRLSFHYQLEKLLKVDDEVAGVALKLSLSGSTPDTSSPLINKLQSAFSKFVDSWPKNIETSKDELRSVVVSLLEQELSTLYDKQISEASHTIAVNRKFAADPGVHEVGLDKHIEQQKTLDLIALRELA